MNVKKEKQSVIWKVLFMYLAVSEIFNWYDTIINAATQGSLWSMRNIILNRLLTQDMLIILVVLLTLNTEKFVQLMFSKFNKTVNQIVVHFIDYVLYMGVLVIYFFTLIFIFGLFQNMNWAENFIYFSILYLAIVMVVEIKKYLKKKEMTKESPALSADEKFDMLKTLRDNNILTQEEYDSKKGKLT